MGTDSPGRAAIDFLSSGHPCHHDGSQVPSLKVAKFFFLLSPHPLLIRELRPEVECTHALRDAVDKIII